jgi:hypothetical protein
MKHLLTEYRVDGRQMRELESVLGALKVAREVMREDMAELLDEFPDGDQKAKKESDPRWRSPGAQKTLNTAIRKVDEAIKSGKTKGGKVYRTKWGKVIRTRAGRAEVDEEDFDIDE